MLSLYESDCFLLGKINRLHFDPSYASLLLLFARDLPLVLVLRMTVAAIIC